MIVTGGRISCATVDEPKQYLPRKVVTRAFAFSIRLCLYLVMLCSGWVSIACDIALVLLVGGLCNGV